MDGLLKSVVHGSVGIATGITSTAAAVKDQYDGVLEAFATKKGEYKDFMESYLKVKLRAKALEWIGLIPDWIKRQLEDPYMPRWVKRAYHKSIDAMWPDIRAEMVWELQVMMDGDDKKYEDNLEAGSKPDCIRAFLRYRLFPYNQGLWYCLRDPVFVFVNILAFIPYMGIYAWIYVFIWVIIDKTDEYQLVYFILSFKGAQFFSWGIVKGFVGFSMYFYCTTFPPIGEVLANGQLAPRTVNSCEKHGPGLTEQYWVSIMSWLLPLVLVWISLFLLPWSKEKGRSTLKLFHDEQKMSEIVGANEIVQHPSLHAQDSKFQKQGGYLRRMLIFDFIVFLICNGLMVLIVAQQPDTSARSRWAAFYDANNKDWQVKQTLFFCQFIYGVFSIVFVPFSLPILSAILTHSAPTAYNENGQCCKFKGCEKPERVLSPEEEDGADAITPAETDGIVKNLSSIARGNSFNMEAIRQRSPGADGKDAQVPVGVQNV